MTRTRKRWHLTHRYPFTAPRPLELKRRTDGECGNNPLKFAFYGAGGVSFGIHLKPHNHVSLPIPCQHGCVPSSQKFPLSKPRLVRVDGVPHPTRGREQRKGSRPKFQCGFTWKDRFRFCRFCYVDWTIDLRPYDVTVLYVSNAAAHPLVGVVACGVGWCGVGISLMINCGEQLHMELEAPSVATAARGVVRCEACEGPVR